MTENKPRGVVIQAIAIVGMFITVWLVLIGCLIFLDRAFLDPTLAAIPEQQQGLIVGSMTTLMGGAVTGALGIVAYLAGGRQAQDAAKAGVDAALTQPGQTTTVSAGPPVQVTTGPAQPNGQSRPCLDCGLSGEEHADVTDHIYRPI